MGTTIKSVVVGGPGTGKTFFCGGFPRSYILCTEPDGRQTLETNGMIKNVVGFKEFIPSPIKDIKQVFQELKESVIEAHNLYKEGKCETLVLDNITYLSENRWMYINKYDSRRSNSINSSEQYF